MYSNFCKRMESTKTLSEAEIKAQNPLIPSNANKGAIQAFENLDLNTAKTAEVREALFEKLTPLIQKGMIKSVDNHEAYVSKGSIAKMISPAAVQKSIDNGFTRAEHLEAVADIENLFAKSHFAKTEPHKSGEKGVSIHRFNSDFKGNNALITIKESVENGKRIYSVELELIPRFNNATPLNNKISEGSLSSLQEARGGIKSESSIAKTDNAIISKNMPFASTKANFTKEEWENLSTQERIQAYKDQRARERAAIKAQEAELNAQKIAAQQAKAQTLFIGYEPSANSFALTKSSNSKEIISQTAPKTEAEIIDFVKNAEKEVESMERFHLNDPKYYYQVHKPDTLMAYEKEHFNNIPKALQEQLFEKFPKIQAQKFADNLREHDLAKEFKEFLDKNILNKPFAKSRDDLKYILSQLPQKDLVDLGFKSKQDFLAFESPAAKANFGKMQAKFKNGDYLGLPEKWSEYQTLKQRESIEQELNLNPTAEFGTNYAEFFRDGKGAIEKIMTEKQGQVSGAFYREDLKELSGNGDIDLVWGEVTDAEAHTGYGLAHIIDKRTAEFMQQGFSKQEAKAKALEFVESLPKMIEEMDLKTKPNEAIKLENDNFEIILKSNWKGEPTDNKWIVSAYIKKEKGESISSTPFTKKDNLSLNSKLLEAHNQNTKLQSKAHIGSGAGDTKTSDRDGEVIQSNAHIGSGLVSGSVAGFETDEQGNLNFNPANFLLGLAGGAVGSKAIAQGFKVIHKNPELKAKVTKELADTLSKGWDSAVKQYPILESLQPRYIVKNEKGRDLLAKHILREVEITPIQNALESLESTPTPKKLTEAQIQKLLKEFDNLENLQEHLSTRADNRQEIYNLLLDTKEKPQIQYKKDSKDKYLKKYKSTGKEPYFYLLVTQDKDKTFITHFKTRDTKYLSKEIADSDEIVKGADIIEELSQRTGDNQSSASTNIIPQIKEKFKFDTQKAKDLYEWHKDSSPLTKDEQGLPKVFYHGTGDDYGFEIFKPNAIDGTPAIYFTTSKKVATSYAQMGYTKEGIYKTFLNIKNPLVVDFRGKSYDGLEYEKLLKKALKNGNDGVIIKNVFDDTGGYYDKQGNFKEIGKADTFIVFNPNQIKAVENKGLKGESGEHKYFNAESPNIYHSNAYIGSGLVSGSVAGFETDEQGNLHFNPANFLLGLAGGAIGSKAIAQGFKAISKNPEFKEKLTQELADTLSKGWDSAVKQYPILESLQPRYIVKNEKGRIAQSKAILKEVEKEEIYRLRESTKQMLHNIAGKNITNAHDGRIAQVSKKNIGKMVSDKAIAKSVANGFSAMEHFNAVNDIESLYKNAFLRRQQQISTGRFI